MAAPTTTITTTTNTGPVLVPTVAVAQGPPSLDRASGNSELVNPAGSSSSEPLPEERNSEKFALFQQFVEFMERERLPSSTFSSAPSSVSSAS